ncbi:MAG: ChaN family lipoprotein [Candidatus Obscuribacterales bacterium]|nr:ChaN family lipoprotein [Candidatus Obscuribacterales bacterium]
MNWSDNLWRKMADLEEKKNEALDKPPNQASCKLASGNVEVDVAAHRAALNLNKDKVNTMSPEGGNSQPFTLTDQNRLVASKDSTQAEFYDKHISVITENAPNKTADTTNQQERAMEAAKALVPVLTKSSFSIPPHAESTILLADKTPEESSDSHPAESTKPFLSGEISDATVSALKYMNKPRGVLEQARQEINELGKNPASLAELLDSNRVLILGETHSSPNPMRKLGTEIMPELSKHGATHLALELDQRLQPDLDQFVRTGQVSDDMKSRFSRMATMYDDDDFYSLLKSARDNHIKIEAVDLPRSVPVPKGALPDQVPDYGVSRDAFMSDNIKQLLNKGTDARVVLWTGSLHGQDSPSIDNSVSEILRAAQVTTKTVRSEIPAYPKSLSVLTPDLNSAVAVPMDKANAVADMQLSLHRDEKFGDWDWIVIFPKNDSHRSK